MFKLIPTITAVVGLIVAGTALPATASQATVLPGAVLPGAVLPGAAGDYCAMHVPAASENSYLPDAPVCFATQAEVRAYLTGVTTDVDRSLAAAASVVLGTVYKDANYGGGSLTLWGEGGCVGATFGFPSLASGWNNSISSAKGAGSCWLTLYTATSYGGTRLNCTPNCATIGSLNDQVRSIVFRPTGTFG